MNLSYLFIGLGGALGAISRVALSNIFPAEILTVPTRTLLINIIGCFAIGLLTGLFTYYWDAPINMRHFLIQGLLGGFTTFSAFSLEFALQYEKGLYASAISYVLLSVILGILFFFFGLKLTRLFS